MSYGLSGFLGFAYTGTLIYSLFQVNFSTWQDALKSATDFFLAGLLGSILSLSLSVILVAITLLDSINGQYYGSM